MNNYSYSNLIELIKDAERYRDDEFVTRANRNYGWLINKYVDFDSQKLSYSVNLVYSMMKTMRTALYQQTPEFSFIINGGDSDIASIDDPSSIEPNALTSKALELSIKLMLKSMKLDKVNRRVMTDAIVAGFGAVKIGYKLSLDDELDKMFKDRDAKGLNIEDIAISDIVKSDHPFITRIDPRSLVFPAGYDDFDNLPWVCQIAYMDRDDVEKTFGVKGLPTTSSTGKEKRHKKDVKEDNQVKLYEFHSYDDNNPRIITLIEGYDKILQEKAYPVKNQNRTPKRLIKIISFNDAIDTVYPLSDVDLCEAQFQEANIQLDRRVKNAKKFIDSYMAAGSINQEELEAFQTGEDGVVIKSLSNNASITPIEKPRLSQDFYQNIAAIQSEIYVILGLTDYEIGGATQERKATEANIMQSSSLKRLSDRITIIDDFIYEQIDTLIEVIKAYQAVDKVFKLTVSNEQIRFVLSNKLLEMLDYNIAVVKGSTVEPDKRAMQSTVTQLVQLSQAFGMVANMPEVYKEGLRMIGISNPDRFVLTQMPMPTPMPGMSTGENPTQPGQAPGMQQQLGGIPQGGMM